MDNRTYRNLKSRLTRAINSGNPHKVIAECDHAEKVFNNDGPWPDDWTRWQRARDDALVKIRYGTGWSSLRR